VSRAGALRPPFVGEFAGCARCSSVIGSSVFGGHTGQATLIQFQSASVNRKP
jgi:hypothetical protein